MESETAPKKKWTTRFIFNFVCIAVLWGLSAVWTTHSKLIYGFVAYVFMTAPARIIGAHVYPPLLDSFLWAGVVSIIFYASVITAFQILLLRKD
jgi:hypothetical protein